MQKFLPVTSIISSSSIPVSPENEGKYQFQIFVKCIDSDLDI